jgi:diacylglycerol O-acyltransferase
VTERAQGVDAVFLHMEAPGTPLHTLKVLVLDTTARGRPVELADLANAVGWRLGVVPRSTQKVVFVPGFARPFWVEDPDFHLDAHLSEVSLAPPGGRRELDALASELAASPLDRSRPLWALTLVHGLEGGRQAVIARVHHAVMDGLAARNAFLAVTTPDRGAPVEPQAPPRPRAGPPRRGALLALAVLGLPGWAAGLGRLCADAVAAHRRARRFRAAHPTTAPFVGCRRNFCNTRCGEKRVCASASLPFASFKQVADATGSTVNGVLHTVVAMAVRRELAHRGEPAAETAAVFGVGADAGSFERRWGNRITPTTARLHSEQADPLECLRLTSESCRLGVELRRETGLEMALRWTEYTCRLSPFFQRRLAYVLPRTVNNVTTANVAGPRETRWFGDVEARDWISFAVTVPPSNFNLTVYSYAGSMSMGLVTAPEVMDEPQRFLDHMAASLAELVAAAVAAPSPAA